MLHEKLKQLRLYHNKTQEEIASILNIRRSTYGEYERGKIIPPVGKIEQLAKIFKVKPQYLLDWPEDNKNYSTERISKKIIDSEWDRFINNSYFTDSERLKIIEYAKFLIFLRKECGDEA